MIINTVFLHIAKRSAREHIAKYGLRIGETYDEGMYRTSKYGIRIRCNLTAEELLKFYASADMLDLYEVTPVSSSKMYVETTGRILSVRRAMVENGTVIHASNIPPTMVRLIEHGGTKLPVEGIDPEATWDTDFAPSYTPDEIFKLVNVKKVKRKPTLKSGKPTDDSWYEWYVEYFKGRRLPEDAEIIKWHSKSVLACKSILSAARKLSATDATVDTLNELTALGWDHTRGVNRSVLRKNLERLKSRRSINIK